MPCADDLEEAFHQEMLGIYYRARDECGYRATRFLQLVSEKRGVQAAHQLLQDDQPSYGLMELAIMERLDISVEALVLQERWRPLFSDEELQRARRKLAELNYHVAES